MLDAMLQGLRGLKAKQILRFAQDDTSEGQATSESEG
jgi:hypothetical protein